MKTKLLFLFLISALGINAQINMEDSTVQAIMYWDMNESYNYRITQSTLEEKGGNITKNDSIAYDVKVSIIDSTATSYTIKWEFSNYYAKGLNLMPQLKKLLEEKKFIYKTNELGEFEELVNWEEIRDNLLETTKETTKALLANKSQAIDEATLNKVLKATEGLLSSKEYIENKAIEPVQIFHTFMGGAYQLGEMLESEIEVPNVINPQKPLIAQAAVWLDEIAEEDNFYVLRYRQMVDEEQLMELTKELLSSFSKNMDLGTKAQEEIDKAFGGEEKLVHSTHVDAAIDNWGRPIYIETYTNVNFANNRKAITIEIEMID